MLFRKNYENFFWKFQRKVSFFQKVYIHKVLTKVRLTYLVYFIQLNLLNKNF